MPRSKNASRLYCTTLGRSSFVANAWALSYIARSSCVRSSESCSGSSQLKVSVASEGRGMSRRGAHGRLCSASRVVECARTSVRRVRRTTPPVSITGKRGGGAQRPGCGA
eukprot:scaffold258431_cov37-Tisochrysis_lutea.AAC.3